MWLHLTIYMGLLLFVLGEKAGLIRLMPGMDKGKRLLFLAALAGNTLGCIVTLQHEAGRTIEGGAALPRRGMVYREEFTVTAGDEEFSVSLQIPGKEEEEQEASSKETSGPSQDAAARLRTYTARYNEQKQDDALYYLPETWEGKSLTWKKPADSSGAFLAALALGAGIFLMLQKSREEEKERQKRREEMDRDYPGLVMKFTLLLQAGMPERQAFRRMALDYKSRQPAKKSAAWEETLLTLHELDSGVSEQEAFRRFGERCGSLRYRTFATLLIQNSKRGSARLLEVLEQESMDAWEDRKRTARIQGELASTRLLLPMILMLLVVMAVVLIPAGLSFYGSV